MLIKRAALGNLKTSFHCTHWHRFFPLKKEFFRIPPSPFSQRELHILTKPSLLRKEGCNRPTRCSEPLRYKVGGASKPSPCFAGWDRLNCSSLQYRSALVVARMRNIICYLSYSSRKRLIMEVTACGDRLTCTIPIITTCSPSIKSNLFLL